MASNLTVDTLTKGAVTLNTDEIVDTNSTQVCKAWVNFNGTGTVAIRASYNVSSITDNGTGIYTVNFTTAMADVNYAAPCSSWYPAVTSSFMGVSTRATGSIQVGTVNPSGTAIDVTEVHLAIFR